jgi:hypothetical protein
MRRASSLHRMPEGPCPRIRRHYAFLVGLGDPRFDTRTMPTNGTYGGQGKAVVVTTPSAALLFVSRLSFAQPFPMLSLKNFPLNCSAKVRAINKSEKHQR